MPAPGNFAHAAKELCCARDGGSPRRGCAWRGSPCGRGRGFPVQEGVSPVRRAGYPCRRGGYPCEGRSHRSPPSSAQDPRGWEGARRGRDTAGPQRGRPPGRGCAGDVREPRRPPVRVSCANRGDCGNTRGRGGEGGGGGEEEEEEKEGGGRWAGGCRIAHNFCKVPGTASPPGRACRGGGSARARPPRPPLAPRRNHQKPQISPKPTGRKNPNTSHLRAGGSWLRRVFPSGSQRLRVDFSHKKYKKLRRKKKNKKSAASRQSPLSFSCAVICVIPVIPARGTRRRLNSCFCIFNPIPTLSQREFAIVCAGSGRGGSAGAQGCAAAAFLNFF